MKFKAYVRLNLVTEELKVRDSATEADIKTAVRFWFLKSELPPYFVKALSIEKIERIEE